MNGNLNWEGKLTPGKELEKYVQGVENETEEVGAFKQQRKKV